MLEKSVLPLVGVAGQISRVFLVRGRRSGSGPFRCQAFRDLIDGKDIAHRAGCFRVAIIRITEHFVFQGAEAGAELRSAVSGLGITLKSLKFLAKKRVLGSGGCRFALRVLGGFWRVLGGFWESWVGSGAGSGGFWVGSGA